MPLSLCPCNNQKGSLRGQIVPLQVWKLRLKCQEAFYIKGIVLILIYRVLELCRTKIIVLCRRAKDKIRNNMGLRVESNIIAK